MTRTVLILVVVLVLLAGLLAGMIAFGTASPPAYMASVGEPFKHVDFSDLPPLDHLAGRDGSAIAYRAYPAGADRIAVLVHGSSGSSSSMHALAKAMEAAGITAYALDIRGHGGTGTRGDIDHAGQLDEDIADVAAWVRQRHPGASIALVGFSSGGGFVLKVAGSGDGALFDRYVLIAPFLRYDAPDNKPDVGWAAPYIPRIIALSILDRLGIHAFDGLPVVAFAVEPGSEKVLTSHYSFRLSRAFAADPDYLGDFKRITKPVTVLVGDKDEFFHADKLADLVHGVRPDIAVKIVEGPGHIGMTVDPAGTEAVVGALAGASPATAKDQ